MIRLQISLLAAATICFTQATTVAQAPAKKPVRQAQDKPNILFIFADDMAWEGVRACSGIDIDTPHLDRLAGRGTIFTHAYNSGAWHGAVCVASRTMLNTGLQLWDAKHHEKNLKKEYQEKGRTWSQRLSKAGYTTCFAGKWHVKMDPPKIFDITRNIRPGMPGTVGKAYNRPIEGQPDPWNPADPSVGGFWKGGKHWSEVLADDFETMLDQVKDGGKPWFMYIAFNAPHDPRQSPREHLDKYPLKRIKLPADYQPIYPHCEEMGAGRKLRDERLAPFPRTPFAVKTHRREYFALISHTDAQIGRILAALEKSGLADNTIIAFTADHGLACGHHGLLGKQNMYDHSVRVPFLIAGPNIPSKKKVSAPVYLQDIMPTSLELAGAGVDDDIAFSSVLPHLTGKGKLRPAIFGAYMESQRMVTSGNKKLILYPKAKVARLFDLASDPLEKSDLIGRPDALKTARSLFKTLQGLQKKHGDNLDLAATFPDLAK
jgi:arylsulfatase A-like enzyme